MTCINCGYEHDEKFCPNCGERAEALEITFRAILSRSLFTITNMDKGYLFNLKNLFLKPHDVINGYIKGKRKDVFNPISFLIITITVYLLGDSIFGIPGQVSDDSSEFYTIGKSAGKFIRSNFKYFWIISIVWLSVSTKLMFRKYNFAEHLTINAFIIGQSTFVGLIGLLAFKTALLLNPVVYILMIWLLYQTFKGQGKAWVVLLQSVGSVLLFFVQLALIAILIGELKS